MAPRWAPFLSEHPGAGARPLRRTTTRPALAPALAFEHHVRQDLSGYRGGTGRCPLNLCGQIVNIGAILGKKGAATVTAVDPDEAGVDPVASW